MDRYENNLICISMNFHKKFEQNEKITKNHGGILTKLLISQLVLVLGF